MERWTGDVGEEEVRLSEVRQEGVEWGRGIEYTADGVTRWSWTRCSAVPDKWNAGGLCLALSGSQCCALVLSPAAEALS